MLFQSINLKEITDKEFKSFGLVHKDVGRSKIIEFYYRYEREVYKHLEGEKIVFPRNQYRFILLGEFIKTLDLSKDFTLANMRQNAGDEEEIRAENDYYDKLLQLCNEDL
jgi:hypothetical protein